MLPGCSIANDVKRNPCTGLLHSLRVPGGRDSHISRQSKHAGSKVVRPMHRPSLPPRKYSWYLCLLEAEYTRWPQCGRKSYVNKKFELHYWESNRLVEQCLNQLRHPGMFKTSNLSLFVCTYAQLLN
jgi:hypothetical protein